MVRQATVLIAVAVLASCKAASDEAASSGASSGGSTSLSRDVELPEGITFEMVTQGQSIFNQRACFSCHGRDAIGAPLAPALNDRTWLHSDGSLEGIIQVIRKGVAQPLEHAATMPAMGGAVLSEEELRHVAAFVYVASRSN